MDIINEFKLGEMFNEADLLIKEGKISDAAKILVDIIVEDPTFGKAHNHLGWIYETKQSNLEKAEEHYKLSVKYSPNYAAGYYNYAIVLSNQKRWDDLTKLLEQALNVKGINLATIYNEYGIMYEYQKQYDKAIDAYKNAIENSLDIKNVNIYKESISRCKSKQEILKSN